MFYYSWSLALVALAVAVITSVLTIIVRIITRQKFRSLQELSGEIVGLMVQTIDGISKLRVAAATDRAFARWAKKYGQQVQLLLSTQRVEDFLALFNTVMPGVTSMVLFSLAVVVISQSPRGWGFQCRFWHLYRRHHQFQQYCHRSVADFRVVERTQPILHAVPETSRQGADPGELSGALKLDNVSFRYGPDRAACAQRNRPLVLDGLTLSAKPGEFIGITGPSGSGKSTIVRLLLGFEKPTSGVVMYDGRDLATLDIAAVRGQLGVVLQKSRLMGVPFGRLSPGGQLFP